MSEDSLRLSSIFLRCVALSLIIGGNLPWGAFEAIHPIGDLLEGSLHGGHQRLNGLQLLRGRIDAGVFGHDVTVVVRKRSERPLRTDQERKKNKSILWCFTHFSAHPMDEWPRGIPTCGLHSLWGLRWSVCFTVFISQHKGDVAIDEKASEHLLTSFLHY